jgi:hypothetical protein
MLPKGTHQLRLSFTSRLFVFLLAEYKRIQHSLIFLLLILLVHHFSFYIFLSLKISRMKTTEIFVGIATIFAAGVSAVPQGVTAHISPGAPPVGCAITFPRNFGLAISAARKVCKRNVVGCPVVIDDGVTQIPDGQIQVRPAGEQAVTEVTQIPDGQIQVRPAGEQAVTEVTQIPDGQIQVRPAGEQAVVRTEVTQIPDGQIQVRPAEERVLVKSGVTSSPIPIKTSHYLYHSYTKPGPHLFVPGFSPIVCAPAPAPAPCAPVTPIAPVTPVTPVTLPIALAHAPITNCQITQISDGQVQAPTLSKRQNGVPLSCSLKNSVLKDSCGRTGYIADNRQLQFDRPPQSGAIYTAGFSVCDDGALALGGQKTWWACGSSDCKPDSIRSVRRDCMVLT